MGRMGRMGRMEEWMGWVGMAISPHSTTARQIAFPRTKTAFVEGGFFFAIGSDCGLGCSEHSLKGVVAEGVVMEERSDGVEGDEREADVAHGLVD